MTALATRTIQTTNSWTSLNTIAKRNQTAGIKSTDHYGNFIWALARKFTASTDEGEAAAHEILIDMWRYATRGHRGQTAETFLIELIARRRLIKRLQ